MTDRVSAKIPHVGRVGGRQMSTTDGGPTVSQILGEITWLISQSRRHSQFQVGDLNWFLLPPIHQRQFFMFYDDGKPVGVALWAYPPAEIETRLGDTVISPDQPMGQGDWTGGKHLWLIDLIAPFATAENKQVEIMFADLLTGPFSNREFRMSELDTSTGRRTSVVIDARAGAVLKAKLSSALFQETNR